MNTELVKLLDAIANLKVIVIGEAILDCYLTGYSDRTTPEAPVPIVTVTQRFFAPGGAANTAVNIRALGGDVTFLCAIGDDLEGAILRQTLAENGVATQHLLTQPNRTTLTKQRVMAGSQLLLRFDRGSTEAISLETEQALIAGLTSSFVDCDALIISDYGYGILTEKVREAIAKLQQTSPLILAIDSKHLAAYRHLGAIAVKPNYKQAIQLLGLEPLPSKDRANQIAPYGEKLLELTGAQIVAVTLDAEGAILFEQSDASKQPQSTHRTTSVKASQSRTSGAGDTFISTLTLALAAKANMPAAADLAAAAAAQVVGKDGTTACSAEELREYLLGDRRHSRAGGAEGAQEAEKEKSIQNPKSKIPYTGNFVKTRHVASLPIITHKEKYLSNRSELEECLAFYRAAGCRIVFTNGCFDILHAGHVSYLNRARCLGDILIIGVNGDRSVSRLKGSDRPINPLLDRIEVLASLSCVDRLVAFEEDTPINLIRLIRPSVYVKGGDYTRETLPEAPIVEALGGIVEILPFVENRSTTNLIQRCQQKP